ncbi:MAG: ATP-binding protein [Candidatus Magnetominusculus sp. LBB02]|nr:ATP-binding protein [Candidatus Magnetominusculus sp. LBB02]
MLKETTIASTLKSMDDFFAFWLIDITHDIPASMKEKMYRAILEMLMNAKEHGNRNQDGMAIKISLDIQQDYIDISVEDEGDGFNCMIPEQCPDIAQPRGRGLWTLKSLEFNPRFNDKGNRITITVPQRRTL